MIQTKTAKVEAASTPKPDKNRWGRDYVKVAFKLDDGWYSAFLDDRSDPDFADVAQAVQAGDVVTITYEVTDKGFKNLKSVKYAEGTPPIKEDNAPQIVSTAVERANNREQRITYLAAQKSAAELVASLVTQGNIPVPTKKADVLDAVLDYVDLVAQRLAADAFKYEYVEEQEQNDGTPEQDS